ncbi:hypothetical protein PT974_02186 [Cladobotryum mycophilum]|uniref:Uncharacterized protein n=1 Tax=Cladobotryum mycophilum TaxID=491253 RepID=A0ABR0SYM3_9HYPO
MKLMESIKLPNLEINVNPNCDTDNSLISLDRATNMFSSSRLSGRAARAIAQSSSTRNFSTGFARLSSVKFVTPEPPALQTNGSNSRWLNELQKTLKEMKAAELPHNDNARVGKRLKKIDTHWLELLSGREGYLLDAKTRGLDKLPVVWGEMDSMVRYMSLDHRHVNNIVYNRWAEAGRVNWITSFAKNAEPEHKADWETIMSPRGIGLILGSIRTDYKFPVSYPDHVSIVHKIATEVDSTSDRFVLESIIFSEKHQRIAARTWEDIVVYDYIAGKKAPLKPFMVEALANMYHLQEKRRKAVEAEIGEFNDLIREIGQKLKPRRRDRAMPASAARS